MAMNTPFIVAFAGTSFSGKTHWAKWLSEVTEIHHIDIDAVRQEINSELSGGHPEKLKGPFEREKERSYMRAAYERMHARAHTHVVDKGQPVTLSATYSGDPYHEWLRELQQETGVPLLVFHLTVPHEKIPERVASRLQQGGNSNVTTMEQYLAQVATYKQVEGVPVVHIDTGEPEEICQEKITSHLSNFLASQLPAQPVPVLN